MAKVRLTAGRIAAFECEPGKAQDFMWCEESPGLGVRVTPTRRGRAKPTKAYIFQGKLKRSVIRITIGDIGTYSIKDAQRIANKYRSQIDSGLDPRVVQKESLRADEEARAAREEADLAARAEIAAFEMRERITVLVAWNDYVNERSPGWSEHHRSAHTKIIQDAGRPHRRGKGVTVAGPLASLATLPLMNMTNERVEEWAKAEATIRPTSAQLALRLLKAFLNWCLEHKDYSSLLTRNAASSKKATKAVGKPKVKNDVLQKEQLPAWFAAVREIPNPVISAYVQCLLLLGCRREELTHLRWTDVDFSWKSLRLGDKTDDERVVPLTLYVASLIDSLPRVNEWVFSSPQAHSGRLAEPRYAHDKAVRNAGLPHLTLHGLRRSFATLSEWTAVPHGIAAQIQGHKPQGTRELNYIRRPLDLLRMWHSKLEAWMLGEAGIWAERIPDLSGIERAA